MPDYHTPVMVSEILDYLRPESGRVYLDCTLGGGAHTLEIVKRILPDGKVVGVDQDDDALNAAAEYLSEYKANVILEKGNFADIEAIAHKLGIAAFDGVLMDLGVSSHQLETPERGFSFRFDAPLDMRMNQSQKVTAAELVNSLSEQHLSDLIFHLGDERWSRRIAKFIIMQRAKHKIETTGELVDIIHAAIPAGARPDSIHAATKTFQALRIAVNRELESLQDGLDASIRLLSKGSRIAVLSYHSLEDRIVKETFGRYTGRCTCPSRLPICACGAEKVVNILTRKPILPTEGEISENPRARSAKLRVAEKL